MADGDTTITNWYARKTSATEAELVIMGSGFKDERGSLQVIIPGAGRVDPRIRSWSDTYITAFIDPDVSLVKAIVRVIPSRGKGMLIATTPPSESASAGDNAAAWTVDSIAPTVDEITVTGTGLQDVASVVLIDNDTTEVVYNASFIHLDGDLVIEWPSGFSGEIERIDLVNSTRTQLSQHTGPFAPAPAGVIISVVPLLRQGGAPGLNVFGIGFGLVPGAVFVKPVGGSFVEANVLSNGWTTSAIETVVAGATTYEAVEIRDRSGAVLASATGLNVTTPSATGIVITAISGREDFLRIEGWNLLAVYFADLRFDPTDNVGYTKPDGRFGTNGGVWTDNVLDIYESYGGRAIVNRVKLRSVDNLMQSPQVDAPALGGPWTINT